MGPACKLLPFGVVSFSVAVEGRSRHIHFVSTNTTMEGGTKCHDMTGHKSQITGGVRTTSIIPDRRRINAHECAELFSPPHDAVQDHTTSQTTPDA